MSELKDYDLGIIAMKCAEAVLGWKRDVVEWIEMTPEGMNKPTGFTLAAWRPCEDWKSASVMLDHYRSLPGWYVKLESERGLYKCLIFAPGRAQTFGFGKSDSGPLAISLAALQAKGFKIREALRSYTPRVQPSNGEEA